MLIAEKKLLTIHIRAGPNSPPITQTASLAVWNQRRKIILTMTPRPRIKHIHQINNDRVTRPYLNNATLFTLNKRRKHGMNQLTSSSIMTPSQLLKIINHLLRQTNTKPSPLNITMNPHMRHQRLQLSKRLPTDNTLIKSRPPTTTHYLSPSTTSA